MSTSLDSILSGGSTAAPEQEKEEQVTQAATEGEGQTEQQTESNEAEGDEGGGQKMVPHQALHAERAKVKRYTEEVADFRKQLADTNAAWERRMAELVEAVKPKQEPPAVPDQFEDGAGFVRHHAGQQFSPAIDQVTQQLTALARDNAISRSSEAEVNEAEEAFNTAYRSGQIDPADVQKIAASPNRFAAAVQWHKGQKIRAEIGNDPAAYRAKVEAELREKITAELNNGGQQTQQKAPAFASNLAAVPNKGSRSGPAWSGPTPLTDIFK